LMMAGRPVSCSYVAFASSRVLSTGSIVGQAVGAAASLCKRHQTSPREVAKRHARECQQLILRQDGHIPGVENEDPNDLARQARAVASSECVLEFPEPTGALELSLPHAQLFPVSAGRIERVDLLLESQLTQAGELRVGLREAPHVWDFRATKDLAEARAEIPPRSEGWVSFPLRTTVEPGKLYYIYTGARRGIFWKLFRETEGRPSRVPVATTPADLPGKARWRPLTGGQSLCLRLTPQSHPYAAGNVIRGTNRPDRWSNIWISDPQRGLPAWIELQFPSARQFNTIQLAFDTDANRRVTLPLFRYPECVRDYRLEYWTGSDWKGLAEVKDNYVRRRVHRFDTVQSERVRLMVPATNGAPSARVYEVRIYREP
jgi:hypothetical protein